MGVAESEVDNAGAAAGEQLPGLVMEENEGFAGFLAADFDVLPAELGADAGAKGLGDGFFGGETRGEKRRGIFVGKAVGHFGGPEEAAEESFAVLCAGGRNAVHFNDVNAAA